MISLERMDPTNYEHLDRYAVLLDNSRHVQDVADHLPEIFEEGSSHRIQQGIRENGALRYFVVIEGNTAGRLELTRHLNDDPSIVPRTPKDVELGFNVCYFINPAITSRQTELAHRRVADKSIREAFKQGDLEQELTPWIPVAMEGDASRGWLMQEGNVGFNVRIDEPKSGIFPQFGIGDYEYSMAHATLKERVDKA